MNSYDPVIEILNAITATGRKARKQGHEYKAQCPAHEDSKASLQIGVGEKGAVLHCHAGCTNEAIMSAISLPMEAMFADFGEKFEAAASSANPRPVVKGAEATYYYEDENGKVLFRVERRKGKEFVQARPDHVNPGEWTYTLGDARRVPYKLPNVVGAVREGETVFIVEGEKDVHTLEGHGIVASCNPGGAGKFKREFAEFFAGAHVVILPDNDEPGVAHAKQVCEHLRDVARSVKIVELPQRPDKGDVTDWFKLDWTTKEILLKLCDETETKYSNRPQIFNAFDLMKEVFPDIVMAVPGIIAEGVTFLVGAPKIGKSWMSLGLGLDVARGGMALGTIPVKQGPVLYLALEDTERRLQRRLTVMIGETDAPPDLHFATHWPRLNAGGLDQLEEWMKVHPDTRMIIIDTWAKVKSAVDDSQGSMYTSDYSAVSAVKNIADEYGVAIVLVHHQRKAADGDPLNTVAGSTGLTGAADATVVLTRQRSMEEGHIYITGRDVEESRSIVQFDSETGRWLYLGEADAVEETRIEDTVINGLANREAAGMPPVGPKELGEALDIKEGTMKWLLAKMATEGKITKVGRGKYVAKDSTRGASVMPVSSGPMTTHVNTVTPTLTGLPPGPGVPSGQLEVTDEEIEAALADDEGYGELDEDEDNE